MRREYFECTEIYNGLQIFLKTASSQEKISYEAAKARQICTEQMSWGQYGDKRGEIWKSDTERNESRVVEGVCVEVR